MTQLFDFEDKLIYCVNYLTIPITCSIKTSESMCNTITIKFIDKPRPYATQYTVLFIMNTSLHCFFVEYPLPVETLNTTSRTFSPQ